jgi:hypothetical protein
VLSRGSAHSGNAGQNSKVIVQQSVFFLLYMCNVLLWDSVIKHEYHVLCLNSFVSEFPPVQQPMRFGNIAFRGWHKKLTESAEALVSGLSSSSEHQTIHVELVPYLVGSFGDSTRIDFGTGHEVAFVAFLYCLCRVGVLLPSDAQDIATVVVAKYMETMRLLQVCDM